VSRDPTKLEVFHRSRRLAIDVYRLTDGFPPEERYGLAAQLRRAATSISTNIVEGCSRSSAREYQRFVDIALASAGEVLHLLQLAVDLDLLTAERVADCRECSDHVVRELQNLRRAVGRFEP
jgi:four helix bundle protein